ncbi:ABC transporter transmembrane domain-containing protein [Levilactobacillus cerevisiae]|uniref:ABC transporter transmembrane domain-containing protein n=1 Tax=Levilactobacillus cerevisiae TaxID=1704076 RepID=UPI000F76AD0F|nr:ABC transporter ATP-binding protein [Levilactobacillus cerevisiae]
MHLHNYFRLAGKLAVGLLILIPCASAIEIAVSYLLQLITDSVTGHGSLAYSALIALVVGYILLDSATYFVEAYTEQVTLNRIISAVRNRLMQRFLRQDTGVTHDRQQLTTRYNNTFTTTVDVLRSDYLQGSVNAYKQICQLVIALTLSVMIQPLLSLIIVLLCLPALAVPFLQKRILATNKRHILTAGERYTHQLQDMLNGLRTIQLFRLQARLFQRFQTKNSQLLHAQNRDQLKRKQVGGISQLLDNVLYLGTWIVGIYFVMHKAVTLGQLVAFSQLMIFIAEPIQSASGLLADIVGGREAAKTIAPSLRAAAPETAMPVTAAFHDLTYDNVSLTIADQPLLQHISLTFAAGHHVLIVGKSGSGKSTLLNLPLSPHTTFSGRLTLNGTETTALSPADLFAQVGLLEQTSYIFNDTIQHNLTLYDSQFSDAQVTQVLTQVGLTDYATAAGRQQLISAQGNTLSGGEKKRLAMARLLLHRHGLTFFDEPLTGLDPHTAHDMVALLTLPDTPAWATITHQYDHQLFAFADDIVIVSAGRLVARGALQDPAIQNGLAQLDLI